LSYILVATVAVVFLNGKH